MRLRFAAFILAGLILGGALGFATTRLLLPVGYRDTVPVTLSESAKDDYRLLVAAAYAADGDLGRAQARLAQLGNPAPARDLAAQAQRLVAAGQVYDQARQLAQLAAALASATPVSAEPGSSSP